MKTAKRTTKIREGGTPPEGGAGADVTLEVEVAAVVMADKKEVILMVETMNIPLQKRRNFRTTKKTRFAG